MVVVVATFWIEGGTVIGDRRRTARRIVSVFVTAMVTTVASQDTQSRCTQTCSYLHPNIPTPLKCLVHTHFHEIDVVVLVVAA